MAWHPSGVLHTLSGRSDLRVQAKAPAGWDRSDFSFGHYRTLDKTAAPEEITTYPGRTFTSTSTLRDRDVAQYWEDRDQGTEPAGFKLDPGARTNRLASNKTNIKLDGDLRPGEKHVWGKTTVQEFFPKIDAAAVARETRQGCKDNKKQNREAHVRLEDF